MGKFEEAVEQWHQGHPANAAIEAAKGEIERLRDRLEKATAENVMLLGELENARSNDRCTFGYLSEIRNAVGHVGDFPSLVQAIQVLIGKTHNALDNRKPVRAVRLIE
jgi:hypothetical protein